MDLLGGINPAVLVASLMMASVPIILAAIGELVVEKSGVLNLGVEGMMIIGAICGFAVAVETGSPLLGFVGGALGGAALSLIFALLTQVLMANQVATGLALTLFGLGLSSLLGQSYVGVKPPPTGRLDLGPLSDIPWIGTMLFRHDAMVYLSIAAVAAVWFVLRHTRTGLVLRAVGENHEAAHALGYHVVRIRVLAILFGGAMAGLGGAYLSLIRVPQWTDGITAGAGWIALAIVVFASWRPGGSCSALSFRRHHRPPVEPAGGGRTDPGAILVHVALSDNDPRAGHHVRGPPPQHGGTGLAGQDLPRLALRQLSAGSVRQEQGAKEWIAERFSRAPPRDSRCRWREAGSRWPRPRTR